MARILHATGRGEVIEKILRDYDETGAMDTDETTDISSCFQSLRLVLCLILGVIWAEGAEPAMLI